MTIVYTVQRSFLGVGHHASCIVIQSYNFEIYLKVPFFFIAVGIVWEDLRLEVIARKRILSIHYDSTRKIDQRLLLV